MMVERSPYTNNMSQLMKDLDQATSKMNHINSSKSASISSHDLTELMGVLNDLNSVEPSFWGQKTFTSEGMNEKIEKALLQIQLFQRRLPANDRSGQRNVDQAIVSISSALKSALNRLDKNLRDIKKLRIGRKVEKSKESKETYS